MSAKVPIYLKRGSRKGKKEKLRDILSSDMISPPLGDFRHTIHIGSGGQGDTFGDISFLQGKFHLLPGTGRGAGPEPAPPFEFTRRATISGRKDSSSGASSSPLLKNAISLPVFGGPQALTLPAAQAPPKPPRLHLDDKTPTPPPTPPTPRREAEEEEEESVSAGAPALHPCDWRCAAPANGFTAETGDGGGGGGGSAFLSHAGSLLSLHVDLGPSILEDVLEVMEKHQAERAGGAVRGSGRQEVLT